MFQDNTEIPAEDQDNKLSIHPKRKLQLLQTKIVDTFNVYFFFYVRSVMWPT